ncbi:glycoside hydrolase family 140 protein [Planctomicrobium piriforme]|uniref:Putative collagen-binding domain of a collagenase n=1 Tax=Planctomicrobium piriforme TaxID=1576369 RepID=A0A1I3N8Z6_9PLAN|nr:glycoside hydrolase family 140 protein [Planctomicrobium piriforme]SFJ05595.1 Putative collagen-binding domain of a collagenase [Planctomicrobium piriforme]
MKHVNKLLCPIALALFVCGFWSSLSALGQSKAPLPAVKQPAKITSPLKVHESGRYLVDGKGEPFFFLGDTAWELFHRLNREEAAKYLDDRAAKGFNVIQAAALAELDGLSTPNPYGHRPLIDNDPTKPDIKPGDRNDYWDHVDDIVKMAAARGMYVGMLPTWGDKWVKKWGVGPEIFTPENAEKYGEWLGKRYKDQPVIWILGGDRDPENEVQVETIRAMAKGLAKGDENAHLMTYHPQGTSNSAQIFHADEWLDFNMVQSGHARPVRPNYIDAQKNLNRTPTKPTVDGEPCYEDHPVKGDTWEKRNEPGAYLPWFDEWDVRKAAYESVLAGACGHTYGDHNIWQFWQPGRNPVSDARTTWTTALHHPGAQQMSYLRELFAARPYWNFHADQSLIGEDNTPEENCARAALANDGSFAIVYLPVGNVVSLKLDTLSGKELTGWWYNPRQNTAQKIGTFEKAGKRTFTPPHSGRNNDWLLILDDADAKLPKIGG